MFFEKLQIVYQNVNCSLIFKNFENFSGVLGIPLHSDPRRSSPLVGLASPRKIPAGTNGGHFQCKKIMKNLVLFVLIIYLALFKTQLILLK